MRARDSNDAPASSRGKDGGGRENVRAHRGLTITCVGLFSGAVHVSIEDGHHGRARTESSFPRPRRSDLEIRHFLSFFFSLPRSTFLRHVSSFARALFSFFLPRLSFFPSLFDSMDLTGFNLEFFFLFFFLTRALDCEDYFFLGTYRI